MLPMPKLQSSSVFISGLRVRACHGVMPQERVIGADFTLDISIETDITQAACTDALDKTISYADVADIAQREMSIPSALLENVAHRIASALLSAFPTAMAVSISLKKHNPPMRCECAGAGVSLRLTRD